MVGFLTESTQPFLDDSDNSNFKAAECEGEASVSTVNNEFQQEVVTDVGLRVPSIETPVRWIPGSPDAAPRTWY